MTDRKVPNIVVSPPGPKSKELMKLKKKYVPKAVYNVSPMFVSESMGSTITDVDGNSYLDFVSGIASLNIGHRHPEVMQDLKEQLDRYLHLCFHVVPYEPYIRLAQKLAKIAPGALDKQVFFINSGAEAVENAVKIARKYTSRSNIITFEYAFHGRTTLTMTLTGSSHPYRHGFGPLAPAIRRTPYAYCYRCSFGLDYPACSMRCLEYVKDLFSTDLSPDEVAAIIVEPVQGEGGIIVPPKEFLPGLRRICDEMDVLLITDEIQTGIGRTGKMFATENFNVVADIVTLAKSLGGGFPLSAVIGSAEIMDSIHIAGLGTTFGGHPLSCVAGLKTVDLTQKLLPTTEKLGRLLLERLYEMYEQYDLIGDVRGLGLMAGVELVKDRTSKTPASEERTKIIAECNKNGLLIIGAGPLKNVIRFLPPLNIDESSLIHGLDIFEKVIKTVS